MKQRLTKFKKLGSDVIIKQTEAEYYADSYINGNYKEVKEWLKKTTKIKLIEYIIELTNKNGDLTSMGWVVERTRGLLE